MPHPPERFRSSTWGWLRGTLAGWAILIVLVAAFAATFYFQAQGALTGAALLAPVAFVAALLFVLYRWVENLAATYEVNDDRLILHRGILNKSIDEIELYRVKDVRIDFTLINQLAGIGTLTITSSDETTRDAPLVIRHVDHARARRERLRDRVNAARAARGVREVDMVHDHEPLEP